MDDRKLSREELDRWFWNKLKERPGIAGIAALDAHLFRYTNPAEAEFLSRERSKLMPESRMDLRCEAWVLAQLLGRTDIPISSAMRSWMALTFLAVLNDSRTPARKKADQKLYEKYWIEREHIGKPLNKLAIERGQKPGTLYKRRQRSRKSQESK